MPFIDGLPAATVVNASDLIIVDQGGTPGVPGTATTRTATVSQFNGGLGAYMPLSGGTFTGPVAVGSNLLSGSDVVVTGGSINATPIGGATPAAGSFTSLSTATFTPAQVAGITGTTTNNNAQAGSVGEYISSSVASGSAVSLTTTIAANITSISLTAGDWDVNGNIAFAPAGSTVTTAVIAAINTTSATLPTIPNGGAYAQIAPVATAGTPNTLPTGTMRISLGSTGTVYLVAEAIFSTSTMTAYGFIGARRAR